jgi:hypothetical protein
MCRRLMRRPMSWKELSSHIRIVDDPKELAQLNAEVELRKLGLSKRGQS